MAVVQVTALTAYAQTLTPAAPHATIHFSSRLPERNVQLVSSGAEIVHSVTDFGLGLALGERLRRASPVGRWIRATKLYVVDLPIVAVGHTLGHESVHLVQLDRLNIGRRGIQIARWPWPIPVMDAQIRVNSAKPGRTLLPNLAAGSEAGEVRDNLFFDDYMAPEGPDYFASAQLIYSRAEEPGAAMIYLRKANLATQLKFVFPSNDMVAYAYSFEHARNPSVEPKLSDLQIRAEQMRRHALLALVDLQLVDSVTRVASYLWSGNERSGGVSLALAGTRFWPRATFAMTGDGIARGVEVLGIRGRWAASVRADRTENPEGPSLWSGFLRAKVRGARFAHGATLYVWSQSVGRGGAAEYELSWTPATTGPTRTWSVGVGSKSKGFMAGAPVDAGWHVSLGLRVGR